MAQVAAALASDRRACFRASSMIRPPTRVMAGSKVRGKRLRVSLEPLTLPLRPSALNPPPQSCGERVCVCVYADRRNRLGPVCATCVGVCFCERTRACACDCARARVCTCMRVCV